MVILRNIEHEYFPTDGALGRGVVVAKEEVAAVDSMGYQDFRGGQVFPLYTCDGSPSSRVWRAWVREEDGKHFVAAIEFDSV